MGDMMSKIQQTFVNNNRWELWLQGIGVTLLVAFFAVLLGIVLGFIVAIIRSSAELTLPERKAAGRKGLGYYLLLGCDWLCKAYLAVIRGTPALVQLMIIFLVFLPDLPKVPVAILGFGINSGAYVAEIMRSGIMSLDRGQMEAGRSLGLNYVGTMWSIILPQAFKNVLPALANEFIVLLKETSIAGYIGLTEVTRASNIVSSRTYDVATAYFGLAVIYFTIVMILTKLVSILERRLRNSER